jgi:hypothetical protein
VDKRGLPPLRADPEVIRLLAQPVAEGLIASASLAPDTPPPLPPAGGMTPPELLADIDQSREDR